MKPIPGSALRVVAYTRVSTDEQGDSGAGLDAQLRSIKAEAKRRGWQLVHTSTDTASGKSTAKRPGLAGALAMVEQGEADALVVAKLDRLSRSLLDFAGIVERSRKHGWQLVAIDLNVDTTTPQGEMMANVLAVFAQFERRLIGRRTSEALAAKRAQGVQLGRPRQLPSEVRQRITKARRKGRSWQAIADQLNSEQVPTAQGGAQWWPATVRKVALS